MIDTANTSGRTLPVQMACDKQRRSSKSRTLALLHSVPIIVAFRFRHAAVVYTCERNLCVTPVVPESFLAGEVTCCGILKTTGIEDDLSVCHYTCAVVIIQSFELFLGHCARLHCKTHQIIMSARSKSEKSLVRQTTAKIKSRTLALAEGVADNLPVPGIAGYTRRRGLSGSSSRRSCGSTRRRGLSGSSGLSGSGHRSCGTEFDKFENFPFSKLVGFVCSIVALHLYIRRILVIVPVIAHK